MAIEEVLNTIQAAKVLGRQPQTLRLWRLRGGGPRYLRLGNGVHARVAYRPSDLDAWLKARTFFSTSEEAVKKLEDASRSQPVEQASWRA